MRNLTEWRKAAKNEEDEHLLAFNYDRYVDDSLGATWVADGLPDAFERFNNHLAATNPPYDCPKKALKEFAFEEVERLADNDATTAETAAFVGVEATGNPKFIALKSLQFLKDNMASVGLADVIVGDLASAIGRVVGNAPDRQHPSGHFHDSTKSSINQVIKDFIDVPIVPIGDDGELADRTGVSGGNTIDIRPVSFGSNPMWLTCEESIELTDMGNPPKQDHDFTLESVYAAGLKEALGLWSQFEGGTDVERFRPVNLKNVVNHEIVFLLAVNLEDRMPVQPNIFSLGYPELFVARSLDPAQDVNGRTVRLRRNDCRSHGDVCECGGPGLPEVVLPAEEVMRKGAAVHFHVCVFSQDLPFDYPDADMIRSKNA